MRALAIGSRFWDMLNTARSRSTDNGIQSVCREPTSPIAAHPATHNADGRPHLKSTLVLWTSEFGSGGPHTNGNVFVMLFVDKAGTIKTGRYFQAEGKREARALVLHQLFVSVIRHMGLPSIDTFGNSCRGPLEWLRG